MEQSSMLFQKDGKNYLQLDCENPKEVSMNGYEPGILDTGSKLNN